VDQRLSGLLHGVIVTDRGVDLPWSFTRIPALVAHGRQVRPDNTRSARRRYRLINPNRFEKYPIIGKDQAPLVDWINQVEGATDIDDRDFLTQRERCSVDPPLPSKIWPGVVSTAFVSRIATLVVVEGESTRTNISTLLACKDFFEPANHSQRCNYLFLAPGQFVEDA